MEESTTYLLLYILFCLGIIGASFMAYSSSPKWQAKLQIIGSISHTLGMLIVLVSVSNRASSPPVYLIIGLVFLGFLLFLIGLLCYCLKTYTAKKANEQLDFLNFQLKDQLEIRLANKEKSPTTQESPQQ